MEQYKLFIDGEFVDSKDGKTFESIDPGTELPFATVAQAGKADAEAAITAARKALTGGNGADCPHLHVCRKSRILPTR